MLVSNVLTKRGQHALFAERIAAYEAQANSYIAKTFPKTATDFEDDILNTIIRSSYSAAKSRGVRRINEHLQYLALTLYLGVAFEKNPLHRKAMRRAGWIDAQDRLQRIASFDALFAWVGRWQRLTAHDCADWERTNRVLTGYHDRGFDNTGTGNEQATAAHCHFLVETLGAVWQNRSLATPKTDLLVFSHAALSYADSMGVPRRAVPLFSVAAMHLGLRFAQDPRHRSIAKLFTPENTAPLKSDIVMKYLHKQPAELAT